MSSLFALIVFFAVFVILPASLAALAVLIARCQARGKTRNRRLSRREIATKRGLPVRMGIECGAGWVR